MQQGLAGHIVGRIPYWYKPNESVLSVSQDIISDNLGRFVDSSNEMFVYGHDIGEAVKESHPLIKAYTNKDEGLVRSIVAGMVRDSLSGDNNNSQGGLDDTLRNYGRRIGVQEPVFVADIQRPSDALMRLWYEHSHNSVVNEYLNGKKMRISKALVREGNTPLEKMNIMNKTIRGYFKEPSRFTGFLKDSLMASALLPHAQKCMEQNNISPLIRPHYVIVSYESLKALIDYTITSMDKGIRREVYHK